MDRPKDNPATHKDPGGNPSTRQINVTGMTPNQRRRLFIDCMNQKSFTAFTTRSDGNQTYYIFKYENSR